MKILLTGASGFLGQSVLELLSINGIETIAVGRTRPQRVSESKFYQVDLLTSIDFSELVRSCGATHLLHLAWYAEHTNYWNSPLNLRWVEATVRLTEAFCKAGGKQVVVAGTCAEYDWSYGYCSEINTPLNPATLYGISKDATRRLVTAVCAEYQIHCAWGRIFQPYGPGEDSRRLIPALIDVFECKRPSFGVNLTAIRDFIHKEDVASGLLTLLQNNTNGPFNICSGRPVEIATVVKLLAQARKCDPHLVTDLGAEGRMGPQFLIGDNTKLSSLGWSAKHKLDEIGVWHER